MTKQYLQMVRYKMSFTILISQAVLYQENISKADQNCVSGFAYISIESIQKEKEQSMGEKDITEKLLEDYNDVFADIINGLIFKGEQRILPESLKNAQVHSQYKAEDGKVHELERDVIKYWKEKEVELAICGIENQSNVKKYMPFRVIGYDGAAYRSQLRDDRKEILPVMTGDERYQKIFQEKRGVKSMCDVAERLEKMGMEKRMEKGLEIGKNTGIREEKIRVYKKLLEKGFSEQEAQEITELPESLGMQNC